MMDGEPLPAGELAPLPQGGRKKADTARRALAWGWNNSN